MSKSLRDQLVEAGLAKAKDAKKIEQQQKRANNAGRGGARKQQSAGAQGADGAAQAKSSGGSGTGSSGAPSAKRGANQGPGKDSGTQPRGASVAQRKARAAREKKALRDKELAEERNAVTQAKALRAEIKKLITDHDQRQTAKRDDDVPYNFKHGKKIKRIHVPPAQLDQLSRGNLVIVNNDGRYHLVTKEIAGKISERDPKWIIAAHDPAAEGEEMDDYYKQFEVPDDLDW